DETNAVLRTDRYLRSDVLLLHSAPLPHRQRNRCNDGEQQEHGCKLERIQILRVEELTERTGVAVALRRGCGHCGRSLYAELLHPHHACDLTDYEQGDDDPKRCIA